MNSYVSLPSLEQVRRMVTWTACPVHNEMVGLDSEGHVIGRCAGCMAESARALLVIEKGEAA